VTARKRALAEAEWREVFALRCRSKRGERLSPEEQRKCELAFRRDGLRYAEMERDVFNATVPFGSTVKR
jgi:hypothetical protein